MLKKDRYKEFVHYFSTNNPNAETELHYSNPFELLVAVILSAQCTDKRRRLKRAELKFGSIDIPYEP